MKTQMRDILTIEYLTRSGMLCDDNILQLLVKGLLNQDKEELYSPKLGLYINHKGKYFINVTTTDLVRMEMHAVITDPYGTEYYTFTHTLGELSYSLNTWNKIEVLLD